MVTVITSTIREEMAENVLANFRRQTGIPEKELIIILNKPMKFEAPRDSNIRIFQMDESATLGECLNFACEQARFNIIAKFDDDDYYGPHYLTRSLQVLKDTKAGLVGKASIFVYFKKNLLLTLFRSRMANQFLKKPLLAGGTLIFQKIILENVQFQALNVAEDTRFQLDCLKQRIPLYAGDFHDYALIRHGDVHGHSWAVPDASFQQQCKTIVRTKSIEEWVDGK